MNEKIKMKKPWQKQLEKLNLGDFSVVIPLLLIMIITTAINPKFLAWNNFSSTLQLMPFLAFTTLGLSFALITGTMDLSVGRVTGLAGMVFAFFLIKKGWAVAPALLVSILIGAVFGFINGFMISKMNIPDFIMTMGTMYIADAIRYLITNGYPLTPLPYNLGEFGDVSVLGMTWPFWLMVIAFAIALFVQKKTVFGRRLYAIGGNKEVAALAGINVVRMKVIAYTICGILAAIAGVLLTIDLNNALPQNGDGWEFKAVASCAVGGVSLRGGTGTALGVFVGVFIIRILDNALIMVGVPAEYQKCATGIVLAAAVMYDLAKQKRKIRE